MRKILFIICWALAGVGLYSCSLDEPSYGKTTSDNYYQKESDIEQALTGAYLQLRTTWNEYALNHYFVGDCSTDDALKGGGNDGDRAEVRDLSDFTIYTTNGEVGRRWEILYRLINRCNDVIYYAPDAIGNEELLKRYANEAKALRAFGYYCLVTTFGEVPLITTPMQPAEILQIPRSPLEKVYECIVSDLTDASALPAKGDYSEDDAYRVTRGFAKTMLAKTYMFKGDFTSAETVLHDIIEVDKDYTLLSDYNAVFDKANKNNQESILEVQYANDGSTDEWNRIPWNIIPKCSNNEVLMGIAGSNYVGAWPGGTAGGWNVPTDEMIQSYEKGDKRLEASIAVAEGTLDGDNFTFEEVKSPIGYTPAAGKDFRYFVKKYYHPPYTYSLRADDNFPVYRYSGALLLLSEALVKQGKNAEALPYINQVRERAGLKPLASVTLNDVMDEMRHELAFENKRWTDLIRNDQAIEKMTAFGKTMKALYPWILPSAFNVTKERFVYAFPRREMDINYLLEQNPGY